MQQDIYLIFSKQDLSNLIHVINEVKTNFKEFNIEIFIDDEQVKFKESFKEFYSKIGNSKFVIMLITDNFLKDFNSMEIAYQLYQFPDFSERIFPIVFPCAKIYEAVDYIDYLHYWELRKSNLENKIRNLKSIEHIDSIIKDINSLANIRKIMALFISTVSNMYSVSVESIKENNYINLIKSVSCKL